MLIKTLVDEYKALQQRLITAGKRLIPLHEFLRLQGAEFPFIDSRQDRDLAEVYLKLDGWKLHANKPDVWVP